ncbi:MAG: hypothetical protein H6738_07920 [Alphaproteobacteria bacterium]|nr:hypothetical protein [Alphaproteobacteria bacterium]
MHRVIPLLSLLASGCAYEEGLLIQNMTGTVHIPGQFATRDIVLPDGTTETLGPDIKLLGPVYLGLFPSVQPANVAERYPYPEVGPQYKADVQGDTYPYGGTTVGDLRYACFSFLACKLSSGRFVDYQEIVDWYAKIGTPLKDEAGAEVTNGEYLRQTCYNILAATTDDEVRITAYEDRNDDGTIDAGDLDFVYDAANDEFVGEFTLWQQEFFYDQNQEGCTPGKDCTGFSLWGWVDSPGAGSFQFSTCDASSGFQNQEYNADFFGGRAHQDLLNFPSKYISTGDVVASEPFVWSNIDDHPALYLDFPVE